MKIDVRNHCIPLSTIILLGCFLWASTSTLTFGGELLVEDIHVHNTYAYRTFYFGPGTITTNDLELYYSFNTNEQGIVSDLSGHGHTGTVYGAAYVVTGYHGAAYCFTQTADRVEAQESDSLEILDEEISISMWVKTTYDGGASKTLAACMESTYASNYDGYWLYMRPSSGYAVRFNVNDDWQNETNANATGTTAINDGQWHHVVAMLDRTSEELRVYIDGLLEGTGDISGFSGSQETGAEPFEVGSRNQSYTFDGTIDDVRLYKRALSIGEVAALYAEREEDAATTNGTFVIEGSADIKRLVPRGDISMGTFTNTP
jgi:hypothetical protein